MRLREWIREHRQEIDAIIREVVPNVPINDAEREMWVMNNEVLYRKARRFVRGL